MASRLTLDVLTHRIRLGIEESEFHPVFKDELDKLWEQNDDLSPDEKTLMIRRFASNNGLNVQINGNLTTAIFHVPREPAQAQTPAAVEV